jgi:hypothetical protein
MTAALTASRAGFLPVSIAPFACSNESNRQCRLTSSSVATPLYEGGEHSGLGELNSQWQLCFQYFTQSVKFSGMHPLDEWMSETHISGGYHLSGGYHRSFQSDAMIAADCSVSAIPTTRSEFEQRQCTLVR